MATYFLISDQIVLLLLLSAIYKLYVHYFIVSLKTAFVSNCDDLLVLLNGRSGFDSIHTVLSGGSNRVDFISKLYGPSSESSIMTPQ